MDNKISKILEECFEKLKNGESLDACLARYTHVRDKIEPLLYTALNLSAEQKVTPSENYQRH